MTTELNGSTIENEQDTGAETGQAVTPDWIITKLIHIAEKGITSDARVSALELLGRHMGMFSETKHNVHSLADAHFNSMSPAEFEVAMDQLCSSFKESRERQRAGGDTNDDFLN